MARRPHKTKEEKLETRRAYRAAHGEELRASAAKWRAANPEKQRAKAARYRSKYRAAIHARQKTYRDSQAGRAYNIAYTTTYYALPKNRLRNLVTNAFRRAERLGLEYDSNLLEHLVSDLPQECPCCGLALDYSTRQGRNKRDRSPSLDRFDNARGYTADNVQVICWRCNNLKSDASIVELEMVIAYMRRTQP